MPFQSNREAIAYYQEMQPFHPLTHVNDELLVPVEEGDELVLRCPNHPEYRQVIDGELLELVVGMANMCLENGGWIWPWKSNESS